MTAEIFNFAGIANAEARDRENEERSGVPVKGAGAILLSAPAKYTSKVGVMVVGDNPIHCRVRHQGATKAQAGEQLVAFKIAGNNFNGTLQYKSLVPGTLVITAAAGPVVVVDDKLGGLWDTGFVGVAGHARGTIDYVNGILVLKYGGAATEPVTAAYSHTDYTDFVSPSQTTVKATGGVTPSGGSPFTVQLGYGRVNPGSVSIADGGSFTFVDDGKGNLIQTDATAVVVGTIDYASGLLTFVTASGALTGNMTVTYTFNPFATILSGGGGQKMIELFPGAIPELSAQAWANGLKNETLVAVWGEGNKTALGSAIIGKFAHFGDEPYRVIAEYSGFPPGGASNDPRSQ